MENYIYKKKRNSIDKIYSKTDNQTYNIGLSLEEKIKMGVVLPDFEFNQKHKIKFGNIVLKYTPTTPIYYANGDGSSGNDGAYYGHPTTLRLFECTHNILREPYTETNSDGTILCAFDFSINYQEMGNYGLGGLKGVKIKPNQYFVSIQKPTTFSYDNAYIFIQYYDETNNNWVNIKLWDNDRSSESNNYYGKYEHCTFIPINMKRKLRIGVHGDSGNESIYFEYILNLSNKLKVFQNFEFTNINGNYGIIDNFINSRGVFFSENKNWYYVKIDNLDNIRVKKDKYVYENNSRYHYGLTTKGGIKNGSLYYRTCNQENNDVKNTKLPFKTDESGSTYVFCKKEKTFNWKKLKFDYDCLLEQLLILTYNGEKYNFDSELSKKRKHRPAYSYRYYESGGFKTKVLYMESLPDIIVNDRYNYTFYDINGNIVTGVTVELYIKKAKRYTSRKNADANSCYIDVIKPYNGKYAYFKYKIVGDKFQNHNFCNMSKVFQRYLDYKEVPENLNHLKTYKPLPGFRKKQVLESKPKQTTSLI